MSFGYFPCPDFDTISSLFFVSPIIDSQGYRHLGDDYYLRNKYRNRARSYFEKALSIAKEISDLGLECSITCDLGGLLINLGEIDQARIYCERSIDIHKQINGRVNDSTIYDNLGKIYKDLGEFQKAIAYFRQALLIATEWNDSNSEGVTLGNLGNVYRLTGRVDEAIKCYEQAINIFEFLGSPNSAVVRNWLRRIQHSQ